MRRKLLFYTHAMTAGGAERVTALLASGLARRGHAVTLAVDFPSKENAGFVDPLVETVVLGTPHPRAVLRLARLLATTRPDVSLSALGVSNLKHAAAALLAGRHRRAVLTHHGHVETETALLSRLGNRLTPLLSRLTARSVFVSDALKAAYIAHLGADPARSVRIYNPVEVAGARPATSVAVLTARGPVLLAVGRFAPVKDFPILIRAFAALGRPDARLILVGDGPDRPAIEAEIARHDLAGRVVLPGYVAEPWIFFREAACFVSSSRQESFGNALVEALAHGLSVVATDCDGSREILDGGRFGELVPVGDPAALAGAIGRALAASGSPEPRLARAQAFSLDRALDRYEELIEEIVASRGAAGSRAPSEPLRRAS